EGDLGLMKVVFLSATILWCALFCPDLPAQNRIANEAPSLRDSVPHGRAISEVIPLTLSDAIDDAVRYNLGMLVSDTETRVAKAERVRALADLLPDVRVGVTETVQQINIAAFGFTGFPGVSDVIGPFNVVDARVRFSQPVVDRKLVHELRRETQE